jgi:hypothetical protein
VTMRKLALRATCRVVFVVATLGNSNAALAQSTAAPKNLRVTGVTDWTVSLRWDAPKGKAPASYVIQCSHYFQRLRLQPDIFISCVCCQ